MKRILLSLLAFAILPVLFAADYGDWKSRIRPDHPRLFFNADTLPVLKEHCRTVRAAEFAALQREVAELPTASELTPLTDRFTVDQSGQAICNKPWSEGLHLVKVRGADEAQKCALVYLVTGNPEALAKGKAYLALALDYFQWCVDHRILSDWHSSLRQNAIVAYDWLYNGLTPEERLDFGGRLLRYVETLQHVKYHRNSGGGVETGNYGVTNLYWFMGLAAYGDGIDDALAGRMLEVSFRRNLDMLKFREKISDGSGLLVAPTAGYSFGMYPFATFFFFHFMKSAANIDVSDDFPQMLDYPAWFGWAAIPAGENFLQYGIGDTQHYANRMPVDMMYTHLAQSIHFYERKHPEKMRAAYRLLSKLPPKEHRFSHWYPVLPLLLTGFDPAKAGPADQEASADAPKAARFPAFGLFFMRSGTTPDATYALFRFGSRQGHHSHYDENGFIIYKGNFLALDSGSRTTNMHHVNYAPQTVAHNCILIHQPQEKMASFWAPWGSRAEVDDRIVYNHGGQIRPSGGKSLACESNEFLSYAAGDAAPTYDPAKCRAAIRQFVHIQPDYFVVYDRVESVRPDQRKEWLVHTQNEPQLQPDGSYRADFAPGRLFVRTLLPENAAVSKVGGPGREFEASGVNWDLPGEDWAKTYRVAGNWRLEVGDPAAESSAIFLHVLQAAGLETAAMTPAKLLREKDRDGIELTDRTGRRWQLFFNRTGPVGGSVRGVDAAGRVLVDRPFADKLTL